MSTKRACRPLKHLGRVRPWHAILFEPEVGGLIVMAQAREGGMFAGC